MPLARQKIAGILCVFQDFLTQPGGNLGRKDVCWGLLVQLLKLTARMRTSARRRKRPPRESNKLSQTIAEIGGVLGPALEEQKANNSALTKLQFTISEWEDTIVTLTGGQTIKNRELKAAIEAWNNGQGVLTETADKLFTTASEQFNGDKNAFMAALSKAMGEVPSAYGQLPGKLQEKDRLEQLIAAKYEELGEARSNMLELMGKLNELNATLGQFETLNRLQHALNTATNNADKAQEDLKAFQGRLEEAQKAYSEAVANLSNTPLKS